MDWLAAFEGVATSTLASALYDLGYKHQFLDGLTRYGGVTRCAGEAYTMRLVPHRLDLIDEPGTDSFRETMDIAPPGSMIVVDSMSDKRAACLGDLMGLRLEYRKVAGLVSDGSIRDSASLSRLNIGVYAASVSGTSRKAYFHLAGVQEVISCAGVAVVPGDVVVADHDGAIVIPRKLALDMVEEARGREDFEAFVTEQLRQGAPLKGLYPPDAVALERYAAWADDRSVETTV